MRWFAKSILALSVASVGMTCAGLWSNGYDPQLRTHIAIQNVNGGNTEAFWARVYQNAFTLPASLILLVTAGIVAGIFARDIARLTWRWRRPIVRIAPVALGLLLLSGCGKYQEPVYENVDASETAFVIPLEGDTSDQAKFDSAEALEKHKVAAKRVSIPTRWNKTGYGYNSGEYIPMVKVIKVSRAPVTREWESEAPGKGNGIWVESSDSIGFSTGFSVTAQIEEPDTALFLYKYKGDQLAEVMDKEIRARVQANVAEIAAKYNMDDLRARKQEIIDRIKADIIPYFKSKGITITTIGQFGGFTYENPKIQEAIDAVFIAQQQKNVAAAQLAAQKDVNERLKEEGQGEAEKLRQIAMGKADAENTEAEGKAKAIRSVAEATRTAASDPVFIELRRLDVQQMQITKWNGQFPAYYMTISSPEKAPATILNIPAPK